MIILNEKRNVYLKDGIEYQRLSTILQATGIIDSQWYTEFGALRGTYVHHACALFDQDTLDWNTLDPRLEGYVQGWAQFRKDSADRFRNIYIEKKLWSQAYQIAGTTDRLEEEENSPVIIDLKTGDSNFAGIQTAGYESMFDCLPESIFTKKAKRYAVKLNENGTYRLKPLDQAIDKAIWISAINVFRFKNPIRR